MRLTELHRTTAFRLSLLFAGLMIAGAAALAGYIYWHASVQMLEEIDQDVIHEINEIVGAPPDYAVAALEAVQREAPFWRGGLFTADGVHIAGRLTTLPEGLPLDCIVFELKDGLNGDGVAVHIAGQELPDGRIVVLAHNAVEQDQFRALMISALVRGIPLGVTLALLTGIAISVASLRRLEAVHRTAAAIMQGDLSRRLPLGRQGDDLDKLSGIVNEMLDRIEMLMEGLKAAGDNIAHDLRTPLTHLRTSLEQSLRSGRTPQERELAIVDAIAQTDGILDKFRALLRISEIEEGKRRAAFQMVDLQQIARAVADLYEPVAADRQQVLALRLSGPAPVLGDRDLLFDLLGNLVDNAIKYTPAGGVVTIVLEGGQSERILAVEDTGPGIPPALHETMFRRFTRADRARQTQGSGLGLSLVAAVARLHDAGVTLQQTELSFRVAVSFRAIAQADAA